MPHNIAFRPYSQMKIGRGMMSVGKKVVKEEASSA